MHLNQSRDSTGRLTSMSSMISPGMFCCLLGCCWSDLFIAASARDFPPGFVCVSLIMFRLKACSNMLIFQDVLLKRAAVRPVLLGYIYMLLKKHIKTMVHMLFQAKYSLKHRHYRLDKHAIISLLFYCGSVLCKRHLYRLEMRCLFSETFLINYFSNFLVFICY